MKYLIAKLKLVFRPKRPSDICRIEIWSETFISAETKTFRYFGHTLVANAFSAVFYIKKATSKSSKNKQLYLFIYREIRFSIIRFGLVNATKASVFGFYLLHSTMMKN